MTVPGARYYLPEPVPWRLHNTSGDELVREGWTDRAVILLDALSPGIDYMFEVEGLGLLRFRTQDCTGLVEAQAYGLVPDVSLEDIAAARANANALQAAIAELPVGGTVRLGPGRWTALPVTLCSDMTLHLAQGAVLRSPRRCDDWPILPAKDNAGRMLGSWEGEPAACFAAPLNAIGAKHLFIEGKGTLDGSGKAGDWWEWPKETRHGARRARGLHLIDCSDVVLLGLTICNAPSWTVHPQGCHRLVAAGLSVEAPADSPNTDGFNPEGSSQVRIEGVRFTVGDDCIAIKAGKRGPSGEGGHLRETRDVQIRHCLMERGHGGVVIGSEMSAGVHDVLVEDCEMVGTDRGLRLKTRRGRGGSITGVTMRRVRMDGVLTALSANAYYHCDRDGHSEWVQSREPADLNDRTPKIDGITVEEVDVHKVGHAVGVFLGLPEAPIRNVLIRNLRVHSFDQTVAPAPPIMADGVQAMRHETIVCEHAHVQCDEPALLSPSTLSIPSFQAHS
jgi:polygalacturonase